MFDVFSQLMNNQDEINGLDNILWEKDSWKRLSLIGDETIINLQSTKVYVFSDSVLCLGRILQHPECNEAWKNRIAGVKAEKSYRYYDCINGKPTEFEWNFPGFTTLQLCGKINDLLSDLRKTPETFTGRIFFDVNVQWHLLWQKKQQRWMLANARVVKVLAKKFGIGQWSFIGPGSEKKWNSMEENSPQGAWDHIADEMLLEFAESGHPTFRATIPLSRGQLKSKRKENCRYTSLQIKIQLIQFHALSFLSISSVSTEQWQLYAKNLKTIKIERDNLWYWWDSQLFLEKSKLKYLVMMKIQERTKLFGSNTFKKLNRFHQKIEWVNSLRKQNVCMLSKLDNISWQEMLVNFSIQ